MLMCILSPLILRSSMLSFHGTRGMPQRYWVSVRRVESISVNTKKYQSFLFLESHGGNIEMSFFPRERNHDMKVLEQKKWKHWKKHMKRISFPVRFPQYLLKRILILKEYGSMRYLRKSVQKWFNNCTKKMKSFLGSFSRFSRRKQVHS